MTGENLSYLIALDICKCRCLVFTSSKGSNIGGNPSNIVQILHKQVIGSLFGVFTSYLGPQNKASVPPVCKSAILFTKYSPCELVLKSVIVDYCWYLPAPRGQIYSYLLHKKFICYFRSHFQKLCKGKVTPKQIQGIPQRNSHWPS